jgi:hypothetical protein
MMGMELFGRPVVTKDLHMPDPETVLGSGRVKLMAIVEKWTTTPPTEPGHWWAKYRHQGLYELFEWTGIVEVKYPDYSEVGDANYRLEIYVTGSEVEVAWEDITHWLGPLLVPEPPIDESKVKT